jgi:hypothetical protein
MKSQEVKGLSFDEHQKIGGDLRALHKAFQGLNSVIYSVYNQRRRGKVCRRLGQLENNLIDLRSEMEELCYIDARAANDHFGDLPG